MAAKNKKRSGKKNTSGRNRSQQKSNGIQQLLRIIRAHKKAVLFVCMGLIVAAALTAVVVTVAQNALLNRYPQLVNLRNHIFDDSVISEKISGLLSEDGITDDFYVAFISICDTQERARVFKGTGTSVRKAWDEAEQRTALYIRKNDFNPAWVKADMACTMRDIPTSQLQSEIGTRDSYFRSGIAFDDSFDMAFLEEELNGNAMLIYDSNEQAENRERDYVFELSNINKYIDEYYEQDEIEDIPDSVILFTTPAWFCDEEGEVYELYDSGYEKGRRVIDNVDAAVVEPLIINGTNYLHDMIKEDGEFIYGWYPITHRLHGSYNILRHAGSVWALLNMTRIVGADAAFIDKIDSAVMCLIDDYVEYRDEDTAFVVERKTDEIKLGGSGLSVIMLTEYMDVFETDKYRDLVCHLANGILDMQNADGSYDHVLHFPGFELKDEYRTVFYDGEATFALSRAYSITKEERYLEGAINAIEHFIEGNYVQYADHWLSYAVNEVTKYVQNPDFYDLALRNVQDNLDRIWNFKTTSHIHTELLMIGWETYNRMLDNGIETEYLKESFDADYFVQTIYKRARFMLNGYFYPEYAMYMKFPSEVADTFFIRQDGFRIRIDDIQHFIGGYYLYIKYYDQVAPLLTDEFISEIDRTGFAVEVNTDNNGDDDEESDDDYTDRLPYGRQSGEEGFIESFLAESELWKPNKKVLVIRTGESDTISCTLDGEPVEVIWRSDDSSIAQVDANNIVAAIGKGETYITAHYEGRDVLKVPVFIDRDGLPPIAPIEDSRYVMRDGIYVNPKSEKADTATLMFTGDIMFLSEQQRYAFNNGTFDFRPSFEYVKPILETADFVAGNLESVISPTSPYKWEQTEIQGLNGDMVPHCNAPATALDALRYAGFDAIVTANNHCLDGGIRSLLETIESLERYKLLYTGTYASEDSPRYLLIDINGIKVALLAYTTYMNLWEEGLTAEETLVHTNHYTDETRERTKQDFARAKEDGADYIIAYMHSGFVNTYVPSSKQLQVAQEFADFGADYVIGAHSHVIHPHTRLTAADGRSVSVIYSMGNFVSSMDQAEDRKNRDAIILQIDLERDENGEIVASDRYIPLFSARTFRDERFVTIPVDSKLNGGYSSDNLTEARKRISVALGDLIEEVNYD